MQTKCKALVVALFPLLAATAHGEDEPRLKTQKEKLSYAIGVDVARNFRKQEVDFDPDMLMQGIRDALAGGRLELSEAELRKILGSFQTEIRLRMASNRRVLADNNRARSVSFLTENSRKEGVATLPGGVQYKVLKAGEGRKPGDNDVVMVNYRGTLLDGTEFDATQPGQPATLQVRGLINGWKQVLREMPEGSRWQIWIPPAQAYGERGVGSRIGPNELLMFDVELVTIK